MRIERSWWTCDADRRRRRRRFVGYLWAFLALGTRLLLIRFLALHSSLFSLSVHRVGKDKIKKKRKEEDEPRRGEVLFRASPRFLIERDENISGDMLTWLRFKLCICIRSLFVWFNFVSVWAMRLNVISSTKTVDYISNCVEPFHFISFCLIVSDRWCRRSRCCGSTFLNWKRYVNHSHIHFFLSFLLLFLPSSFSSPLISAMHHQINYIHVLLLLLVGRRRRCRATPRHAMATRLWFR